MDESHVKTNSLRAWVLAARPKTLIGAAVPVMVGAALAMADTRGHIEWTPCFLCFLFAFLMQIDANFVNDYFDFRRGNDAAETRLGPRRACAMGWVTPRAMLWAMTITTGASCLVGLPLIRYGGWQMIIVGVLCALFCFLYTTTLSYHGLGDVLVLVFFGLVPVCLTYYLSLPTAMQTITAEAVVAALACGFVIDTLLLINNNRDIDNDRRDGKRTLVVRVGHHWGMTLYLWSGLAALGLGICFVFRGHWPAFVLPVLAYLWPHRQAYRHLVSIDHGQALNGVLGETARNIFIYGAATAVGFLLSMVME